MYICIYISPLVCKNVIKIAKCLLDEHVWGFQSTGAVYEHLTEVCRACVLSSGKPRLPL